MAGSGLDWDAVLRPVSSDAPGGPDLSYAPGRQLIEEAFDQPPEDVNWPDTIALIAAQAQETRDAWLAVALVRAGARGGDLAVIEDGLRLLAEWFDLFWDTMHPSLEEYGVEGRSGACEALVRIGEFLGPLRRVPLIEHPRLGRYAGAEFERFAEEGAAADGYGQFRAAVADLPVAQIDGALDRLESIRAWLSRADTILSDQAERLDRTGTNFRATYETLEAIDAALKPFSGRDEDAAAQAGSGDEAGPGPVVAEKGGTGGTPGVIASRADVARALDAIVAYYQKHEPSSPVPVALGRVKGWITMDFLSILADVSPDGLEAARRVLRPREEEGNSPDLM